MSLFPGIWTFATLEENIKLIKYKIIRIQLFPTCMHLSLIFLQCACAVSFLGDERVLFVVCLFVVVVVVVVVVIIVAVMVNFMDMQTQLYTALCVHL